MPGEARRDLLVRLHREAFGPPRAREPGPVAAPGPSPATAEEPPLPPMARMVGSAARAAIDTARRFVRGEPITASPEAQAARWEACRSCSHFRASDRRCGKLDGCGCYLDKKVVLAASACPIGKWGPEPAQSR